LIRPIFPCRVRLLLRQRLLSSDHLIEELSEQPEGIDLILMLAGREAEQLVP